MAETTLQEFDAADFGIREHRSLWGDAWQRLISSNTARLGMAIVVFFILSAVLSHFFWDYNPKIDLDYSLKLKAPNLRKTEEIPTIHPFGTDKLGRDIFRRVVHGGWNSLRVGLVAVGISLSIGGVLGLVAGFYESMPLGRTGRAMLSGGIGLVLGLLPTWTAGRVHISGQALKDLLRMELVVVGSAAVIVVTFWIVERLVRLVSRFNTGITPDSAYFERERHIVTTGAGRLGLGAILAWVVLNAFPVILFWLLGVTAVFLQNLWVGQQKRLVLFAVVGLFLGAVPAYSRGLATTGASAVLGMLIGLMLAFSIDGPVISGIIMRLMDILLVFPGILLAIAIVAMLGPGLDKGMIAIGVVGIPVYARLVRSSVLSVLQNEYIMAAQSVGVSQGRILLRHVLPNSLSPVIVQATMGLAGAILSAAALGFLGLGAIPPEPEWGAMLGDAYRYLTSGAWWAVLFPGLAIMLSVLGFNLLGDGLRDALDPKLRV